MERDLTHAEAAEGFRALSAEVGPKADIIVSLDADHRRADPLILRASVYPMGCGRDRALTVYANTWTDLLRQARAAWVSHGDKYGAEAIRNMALRIISITADQGSCTEFSLCKSFSPAEVKTYGDRACEEATRIAGNGPFSIVRAASESEAA